MNEREPAPSEVAQAHSAMSRLPAGVDQGQSQRAWHDRVGAVTGMMRHIDSDIDSDMDTDIGSDIGSDIDADMDADIGSDMDADMDADEFVRVTRRAVDTSATAQANRRWWDHEADGYQAEHGAFLRDDGFVWCPEGIDEADARLLGDVTGRRVLEVGCGAAQCSRWLLEQGGQPVATDLSGEQLRHARTIDRRLGTAVPLVQADAGALPFADASFDLACSAFGAVPFVADSARVMAEVARVLRPGGRWVFSATHPVRWCFPDDPGPPGLVARESYWDRRPYVEEGPEGRVLYVEHHRTLGDRVREIVAAGLQLVDLVEPEWPEGHRRVWGQWSPVRGAIIPGTAIYVCVKPG